jgi:hypothetical protein
MGNGNFDSTTYRSARVTRAATGVNDFHYSETASSIHANLDPRRISGKLFKVLESRDSEDHPNSNAIIICLDVTGSNISRAREVQAALPGLMETITKYIPDPQISIAANDDVRAVGRNAFQISEFESDNRIDEHIRSLWLTGNGGGNGGESYDLPLYAAAYKTGIDCFDKRGRKGYLFLYADEFFFPEVNKLEIKTIFGDDIDRESIPIADLVAAAKERFHVFVLSAGSEAETKQYRQLFGNEFVAYLEYPSKAISVIAAAIALNEKTATTDTIVADLAALGTSRTEAEEMIGTLFGNRTW